MVWFNNPGLLLGGRLPPPPRAIIRGQVTPRAIIREH